MQSYPIILFSYSSINALASSFGEADSVTEQSGKQALPDTLQNNAFAITEQLNIKG